MSSDYETNWIKGILSAIILFAIISFVFYFTSPVWAGFVGNLYANYLTPQYFATHPYASGVNTIINDETLSIFSAFFALILTILVYIIVLPFLREQNQIREPPLP